MVGRVSDVDDGQGLAQELSTTATPTGQQPAERRDIAAVLDELQAIRQVLEDIRDKTRTNKGDS
jgi:hypothetical protein